MKAIIEMPKGDDRRRHFRFDKTGFIDLGLIKDVIPVNGGLMPVNYGYVCDTLNVGEGDEVDVLIFSKRILKVGEVVDCDPLALISRSDGDDKIVAADETVDIKNWLDIPESERNIIEKFFSFHHEIIAIKNSREAKLYLEDAYKHFKIKSK